jgi:hypothetical protein
VGAALPEFSSIRSKNRIVPDTKDPVPFDLTTTPTPLQQRAFDLLGVNYRM